MPHSSILMLALVSNQCDQPPTSTDDFAAMQLDDELRHVGMKAFTASEYKPGVVRHIVLFRYKDTVRPEQREEVISRFLSMQSKCLRGGRPYIVSIETGQQHSGEGVDLGLQQGFVVTFNSQGDRNYYVGRPIVTDPAYYDLVHQDFKDFVGPLLAEHGVLVFDYTAAKNDPLPYCGGDASSSGIAPVLDNRG